MLLSRAPRVKLAGLMLFSERRFDPRCEPRAQVAQCDDQVRSHLLFHGATVSLVEAWTPEVALVPRHGLVIQLAAIVVDCSSRDAHTELAGIDHDRAWGRSRV